MVNYVVMITLTSTVSRLCDENRKYGLPANRMNVAEFKYYFGKNKMTSGECLAWEDTYGHRCVKDNPINSIVLTDSVQSPSMSSSGRSVSVVHCRRFGELALLLTIMS